ncbi:MAG TPA: hypothetical protein PLC98_12715 [Anaerolineales bacterium]|nr:hypothetical protein [Anaerolineales bacterium]
MPAAKTLEDRLGLPLFLVLYGALIAAVVGPIEVIALPFITTVGSGSAYAELLVHPIGLGFMLCLCAPAVAALTAPFGALSGLIVGRTRFKALACGLVVALLAALIPFVLFIAFLAVNSDPFSSSHRLNAELARQFSYQSVRLTLVVGSAIAAPQGGFFGWLLWRRREEALRDIERAKRAKPLDWRWE